MKISIQKVNGLRARLIRIKRSGASAEDREMRRITRIENKAKREEALKNLRVAQIKRRKEIAEAETALHKAENERRKAEKEVWDARYAKVSTILRPLAKGAKQKGKKGGKKAIRGLKKFYKGQQKKARVR